MTTDRFGKSRRLVTTVAFLTLDTLFWSKKTVFMTAVSLIVLCTAVLGRLVLSFHWIRVPFTPGQVFDTLMSTAVIHFLVVFVTLFYGTALISDEVEGKTLTYLFVRPVPKPVILVGKYLERGAKRKSSDAIRQLMKLQPAMARVRRQAVLTCIPADNRDFNVPAECQHLYNVCVGPSDPTTQVGPLAAPTWDDAGERTGPFADGPDLKIGFHVPDGVWQVCFYMVDYDSQARSQVLELPGWANQTVSGFGDGATVCYPGLMGGDYTLKVRSTAGPNSVISSIGWVRLDGQGQPVTDPELCAGLGECEPCSYTQGGWGQTAKGGNVGTLRDAHFSEVYPAGVTVGQATCTGGAAGSGNVMTFASSLAVENFLPCGGTPDMLSKDYSDPTCGTGSGATSAALRKLLGKSALSTNEIKNVFAAQVLALKLNVDFSDHLTTAPDVPLGNLLITEGPFAGMTVRAFLAEAEEALSCGDLNSWSAENRNP